MKVVKNKVYYTETQLTMTAEEVKEVLANYLSGSKNVTVTSDNIEVVLSERASNSDELPFAVFDGITATVLKRGRAPRKPKDNGVVGEPVGEDADGMSDPAVDEELKAAKKRKKKKQVEDDEPE